MELSRVQKNMMAQASDDIWLRAMCWESYVNDDIPDVKRGSVGVKKLKELIRALDALDPDWETRPDRLKLVDKQVRQMYPEALKKRLHRKPMISNSGSFSTSHAQQNIICQLEAQVRHKLTFPGASQLDVRVVQNTHGKYEMVLRGPDDLVELARKRLGLPLSASRSI